MTVPEAVQIIDYASKPMDFTLFATRWIPKSTKIVACGETHKGQGVINLLELTKTGLENRCELKLEDTGIKACSIHDSNPKELVVGNLSGNVKVIDLEANSVKWGSISGHQSTVNAIDFSSPSKGQSGYSEFVSGSRDGTAKLWDLRDSNAVAIIRPRCGTPECWSVCFGNCTDGQDKVIVTGYDSGDVKLIDMRKMMPRWETNLGQGVCHVSFDRKDIPMNKLSFACTLGLLHLADVRTFHPESGYAMSQFKVGASTLWGCHFLPQNRDIMAITSGNGSFNLFKYEYPKNRVATDERGYDIGVCGTIISLAQSDSLSSQPIVSADWHYNKKGLCALASLDQIVRVVVCLELQ